MSFTNYISKYSKNTESVQTHLSFNKKKYNIPEDEQDEFHKKYFESITTTDEDLYLIEKISNSKFAFFLDLDLPKRGNVELSDEIVLDIINISKDIISEMFVDVEENNEKKITNYIVSKNINKYHINFYNLIVNGDIAKRISNILVSKIDESVNTCVDSSVYRTGLRLLGSKKLNINGIYQIYKLETGDYIKIKETKWNDYLKTIIKRKYDEEISKLNENYTVTINNNVINNNNTDVESKMTKKIPIRGIKNYEVVEEIAKLLNNLKITNEFLENVDVNVSRIYATQNKAGMFCYYVSIGEKYCPFKCRQHTRESNPIYIEISISGIYIKCYDEECLRKRYPENGIMLPNDFETEYSNLYFSMTTKYWKTELEVDENTKRHLEESLNGSHYQIAKTVFEIYKERFRVDDVRNSTWYEYDGFRWRKSHNMNILISEELPKYYKTIKVTDTSQVNNDLEEFLVNNEKVDANFRNGLVDKIIRNLENVTFKNNIINQTSYLYKAYDEEFYTKLDSNPYLLAFKNGVYDFEKNIFRKSVPDDYLTFSTGYDFMDYDEKNEKVQEIYEFLAKIITNTDVREYLLKILGRSLIGIPEEKFYIWTGLSGANGKSTLVNFMEATLGDYITSVDVSLLTNKRPNSGNASPDVIRLRGKRIFTFQEPEHDDKLRTGILKQYTGGDTIIARELFKAPVCFKLQGTMIMCCNDLPSVASIDGGTWRRIRVIEFKSRFCENPIKSNEFNIDPNIKYKIKEWKPYFMSILIHWYNKSKTEGMKEPDEVKKATTKYKDDNDRFNEFFNECLEEDTSTLETNKKISEHFKNWWYANYPTDPIPKVKELIRAIKIKYGNEKEIYVGGIMRYGFNLKIKNSYEKETLLDEDEDEGI